MFVNFVYTHIYRSSYEHYIIDHLITQLTFLVKILIWVKRVTFLICINLTWVYKAF